MAMRVPGISSPRTCSGVMTVPSAKVMGLPLTSSLRMGPKGMLSCSAFSGRKGRVDCSSNR